ERGAGLQQGTGAGRHAVADAVANVADEVHHPVGNRIESGHRGVLGLRYGWSVRQETWLRRDSARGASAPPRLGPMRRHRVPWILRPRMLRIPPLHLPAHLGP